MRENTKAVAEFFESIAIENALKLGISNLLIFGEETYCQKYKNITLFVSEGYDDVCSGFERNGLNFSMSEPLLCSFLHRNFSQENLYSVLEQLKKFPEGTTVVFTHSENMSETEKLLSSFGFRTVEHFSADKVADSFQQLKSSSGNTCYCLCVRK